MNYTMKAGALYYRERKLAQIKSVFTGPEKKIFSADNDLLLCTRIRNLETPPECRGNVRFRQYVLHDAAGAECAVAKPDYAEGDDPAADGWPICRMPQVDHAHISMNDREYCLTMRNSQNYVLNDALGKTVIQIYHRGLAGGWDIEAAEEMRPEIICGVFVFCRYIEKENEFVIV